MTKDYKIRLKFDKRITELLKDLGLTDKEILLYLICMQNPETDVDLLVAKSGLKRPTTYYVVRRLIQKGLISESRGNGRLIFKAASIEGLQEFTRREAKKLESYSDEIASISNLFPVYNPADSKADVERFIGVDGIKSSIEKALFCKSREWLIVAPASHNNFFGQFDRRYWDYFMDTREKRGIKARSLWEYETKLSRNLEIKDLLARRPRFLPKELKGTFQSIMIVFDDKALFITSLKEKSAVIITSDELSTMMKAFFEGLWMGSGNIANK